ALLNPFSGSLRNYESKTSNLNSRLSISMFPFKGVELKTSIGYSTFNEDSKYINPIISQNPQFNPTGELSAGSTKGETWIIEPHINYRFSGQHLKAEVLIGSTLQATSQRALFAAGIGYQDDNLIGSVTNAPTKTSADATGQYKYVALFGRINLNLKDK